MEQIEPVKSKKGTQKNKPQLTPEEKKRNRGAAEDLDKIPIGELEEFDGGFKRKSRKLRKSRKTRKSKRSRKLHK